MLDSVLSFALLAAKEWIIIPVSILGFYFVRPQAFVRSLIALLAGMIVVAYLKTIFQIPLKPHLGPGFAFPSGHMFSGTVFWVVLSWELRQKLLSLFTAIILSLLAIALVHFNYHTVIDVIAGFGFGVAFVGFHIIAQRFLDLSEAAYGLLMLVICLALSYFMTPLLLHIYLALGALAGLTLGSLLFKSVPSKIGPQVLGVVVCGLLTLLALKGFPYIIHQSKQVLTFVQYMFIGFSLRLSAHLVSKV